MKRLITNILVLIFLSVISSCRKPEVPEVRPGFDENIKIKVTETIDSVKRTLSFRCNTEKIFECFNYAIQAKYILTDDKIIIHFIKIVPPNICLTAFGPASTIITLDGLSNKTYGLELHFGTDTINGQLDVTPASVIATMPTQTKVQFENPELKRIPDNTIYGTVHYHFASASPLVDRFLDTLQLYGAVPTLYAPGNYWQFQIEANGEIKQTQDIGYYFTRYYIFHYSERSGQLRDLVQRFGVNYGNLLSVTLNTTKGETFYSWRK